MLFDLTSVSYKRALWKMLKPRVHDEIKPPITENVNQLGIIL